MNMPAEFSIQAVARQTGLSAHVIRAWERRYGAVEPRRTSTFRRFFTAEEVERLSLLRRATLAGHPIGVIAKLPAGELQALLQTSSRKADSAPDPGTPFRGSGLAAVQRMDNLALDQSFRRALVTLGHQGFLRHVVAPMAEQVGELWREGMMTAAHEHFFTAEAKTFLGHLTKQFAPPGNAPVLIASTPTNQHHELGACLASVGAAHLGWRVIYLGPALPAAEIAGAATQSEAHAVALSIVYPADDPDLPDELRALRKYLPPATHLLVGGRGASGYREVLAEIGAIVSQHLDDYFDQLDRLRRS